MATPPPSSLPFEKSRVRVSLIYRHWLILLLLSLAVVFPSAAAAAVATAGISYADHCADVVPESAPVTGDLSAFASPSSSDAFQLSNGHFSGGDALFGGDDDDPDPAVLPIPRSFFFRPQSVRRTGTTGILHVAGTLSLRGAAARFRRHLFHLVRPRLPKTMFVRAGRVNFELSGFWSESTGKLCMVGTGSGRSRQGIMVEPSVVFKLRFPKNSNISSSLVFGILESLDAAGGSNHFDTVTVLAYAQLNYEYSQISLAKRSCTRVDGQEESLGVERNGFCSRLKNLLRGMFRLEHGRSCFGRHCGPFSRSSGLAPKFMSLNHIQCSDNGKLHMYIGFSNVRGFAYGSLLVPEKALVGEGVWDWERSRLCLVACQILRPKESSANFSVGECAIRISLWFPAVWSVENRSFAVGRIWSEQNENDSGYFDPITFQRSESNMGYLTGLKYKYTKMDVVSKFCIRDGFWKMGKRRYPDGKSFSDFTFDMSVRDADGKQTWGHAFPVSIGETFYGDSSMVLATNTVPMPPLRETNHNFQNVSYKIRYIFPNASLSVNEPVKISAEGIYNPRTGLLCMVGCLNVDSSIAAKQARIGNSLDCEILINIQLPPVNSKAGEHLNGTIRSMRGKLDPLFFEPLEITSNVINKEQATKSSWRMDLEITMVLISLTLTCIFIGVQLFYVHKNPDVLASISITMLVVLTLGHMIPLVLNFEAMFLRTRNRQNVLQWTGGWLEVNEVIVRVITMVAFLLQFRLLQAAWSARSADESKKGLWVVEKKALKMCLPLYFAGGLIALFIHMRSSQTKLRRASFFTAPDHSFWEDLKSFAGLILDGFLLPQVILNVASNSKEKSLSAYFYFGTSAVRALPHVYDAFRARHYLPRFKSSYIYASPDEDFYSLTWDIIIPCGGLLFAFLIYLQQQFGGAFFLPLKYRKIGGYETVPVVNS